MILFGFVGCGRYSDKTPSHVKVSKPTGELQCQPNSGIDSGSAKKELIDNGIEIIDYKLVTDGQMHAAVCGTPAGEIHVFTVNESLLHSCFRLGYKKMSQLAGD